MKKFLKWGVFMYILMFNGSRSQNVRLDLIQTLKHKDKRTSSINKMIILYFLTRRKENNMSSKYFGIHPFHSHYTSKIKTQFCQIIINSLVLFLISTLYFLLKIRVIFPLGFSYFPFSFPFLDFVLSHSLYESVF